jgi:hypothetical protein
LDLWYSLQPVTASNNQSSMIYTVNNSLQHTLKTSDSAVFTSLLVTAYNSGRLSSVGSRNFPCLSHINSLSTPGSSQTKIEVEVTLRLTVGQSVCLSVEHPCGTSDQILLPVGMLLPEICCLVSMGRPL